jgi:ABC-type nitrate/sulfonate/bicarbonate transport system permease component
MAAYLIDWAPPMPARRRALAVGGAAAGLLVWEAIGRWQLLGTRMPAISEIVVSLAEPRISSVLARSIAATLPNAAQALVLGTALGVIGALIQLTVPLVRPTAHRVAALLNAVPAVILSPILITIFGVQQVPVVVGMLGVFFSIFVVTSSGFRNAPAASVAYLQTLGASPWMRFRHVEGPAALPYFADGLRLAGPSALLGTMFGEWFGSPTGLGVLIQVAWQNFQIDLLWAAALTATMIAIAIMAVLGALSAATSRRFA